MENIHFQSTTSYNFLSGFAYQIRLKEFRSLTKVVKKHFFFVFCGIDNLCALSFVILCIFVSQNTHLS